MRRVSVWPGPRSEAGAAVPRGDREQPAITSCDQSKNVEPSHKPRGCAGLRRAQGLLPSALGKSDPASPPAFSILKWVYIIGQKPASAQMAADDTGSIQERQTLMTPKGR